MSDREDKKLNLGDELADVKSLIAGAEDGGGKSLYGWIVGEAEEYDTPSPLAEFGLNRPPMSWQYVEVPDLEDE